MRRRVFFAGAVLAAVGLAGCAGAEHDVQAPVVDMTQVKQDLEVLAQARVLLGHQSVGRDVLAGLRSLVSENGAGVRVIDINGTPPDDAPGVFSSHIGQNGDPDSKCEMFSQLLTRPERPQYNVAMMKFCYADLREATPLSADEMVDRYARMVESIRSKRPDIRLVHVTVPLKADATGTKAWLKRKLGMSVESDAANVMRNDFNAKLKERFANEPLFDLAAVESTYADGGRSSFDSDGRAVYTLARAYTHDGGHLNPAAQRLAAAAFVRTLADVLATPGGRAASGAR